MKQYFIIGGIVVALIAGIFIGKALFSNQVVAGTQSPAGTTFSSAKISSVIAVPASATATSTSFLNTDSNDRIVQSSFIDCNTVGTSKTFLTGAGLASLQVQAATTSVANQGLQGNTNYVVNINLATSTTDVYVASTTPPVLGDYGRIWPTGTNLTITWNATNTASCVEGVNYLAQ